VGKGTKLVSAKVTRPLIESGNGPLTVEKLNVTDHSLVLSPPELEALPARNIEYR